MKVKNLVIVGVMLTTFVVMTSGSTRLAIPLVPVAIYYSVTQHWPYLVGAGVAGAALLKLKAAGTVGAYLYLRDKGVLDVSFDHNQAGWDSAAAAGWEKRRQDTTTTTTTNNNNYDNTGGRYRRDLSGNGITFNPSLDEVLAYDELGCGLRLVCELSAVPSQNLQDDEKIILALFGGEKNLPDPHKASRGKLSYAYAALLGNSARDGQDICSKVYRGCPHEGRQIMDALRAASV